MPTYDYECDACGHEFEVFQSMSEGKLRKCPKCGEKPRRRIGLGAGVVFKGSGFYQTDYRSDAYKKSAKSDSSAPSEAGSPATKPGDAAKGEKKKPSTAE